MKHILAVFFMIPALVAVDDWQTFTAEEHGFSVLMPCEPEAAERTDKPGVAATYTSYDFECLGEVIGCMVSRKDNIYYPDSSAEAVLDMETDGADAAEWGLKKSKIKKIRYLGFPGREVSLVFEQEGVIECSEFVVRILVIGKNIYTLVISGPCQELDRKTKKKFFRSFRLLD